MRKNEVKEVGCGDAKGSHFEIKLTEQGKKDAIFNGLDTDLKIFHLHGETVDITENMTLLATSKSCKNQVVRIGKNAYGLQGHFELTEEKLKLWISKDKDLQALEEKLLMRDYHILKSELENNAGKILFNFLGIARIIPMEVNLSK